ncbi:ABC transporter permease [Candidatus Riflebacteria bacterium]
MLQRFKQMLIKEFIQILRDKRMKAVIFVIPVIQLFIFAHAATLDLKVVMTAVYDQDNSSSSRELTKRLEKSGYFVISHYLKNEKEGQHFIDAGRVDVWLTFPPDFENKILQGNSAQLGIILDGNNSNTAAIILNYIQKIILQYSQELFEKRWQEKNAGRAMPGRIDLRSRMWFNENLESLNFYVPGILSILVTLITLMLTGMAVVREKEIGTMEQIMVTPISSSEFILGKTIPFAIIGMIDVSLVIFVAVNLLGVPMRGSYLLLYLCFAIYIMTTLGMGLFISTISGTQQQAMMTTFFFFFPAMLLSGFMFPIPNMPEVVQWLTLFNPLRYLLVIVRGIFLKGVGFEVLLPQILPLFCIGILTLSLSVTRFKKNLA